MSQPKAFALPLLWAVGLALYPADRLTAFQFDSINKSADCGRYIVADRVADQSNESIWRVQGVWTGLPIALQRSDCFVPLGAPAEGYGFGCVVECAANRIVRARDSDLNGLHLLAPLDSSKESDDNAFIPKCTVRLERIDSEVTPNSGFDQRGPLFRQLVERDVRLISQYTGSKLASGPPAGEGRISGTGEQSVTIKCSDFALRIYVKESHSGAAVSGDDDFVLRDAPDYDGRRGYVGYCHLQYDREAKQETSAYFVGIGGSTVVGTIGREVNTLRYARLFVSRDNIHWFEIVH